MGRSAAAVACGAVAGAAVRWAVAEAVPTDGGWPWAVLAVNVIGAFLLGLVLVATRHRTDDATNDPIRLALGTGFCGALTTFSTLAVDVASGLRGGETSRAVGVLVVSVVVGVAAFVAGRALAVRREPS